MNKDKKDNDDIKIESKKSLKLNRNDNRTIHNRINVHNNKKINKKEKIKLVFIKMMIKIKTNMKKY